VRGDFRSTWISWAIPFPRIHRSSLWSVSDYKEEEYSCTLYRKLKLTNTCTTYGIVCSTNSSETLMLYMVLGEIYIYKCCALFSYERGIFSFVWFWEANGWCPLPLPCPINIHISPSGCYLASHLLSIRQLQTIIPPSNNSIYAMFSFWSPFCIVFTKTGITLSYEVRF
jgi:hypothetical protein